MQVYVYTALKQLGTP